jgi:protein-S-isoprenylcysteine O-methyltransferase Ste14
MYSGALIFFSGAALWLGSIFTATFGAALLMLVFLPRVFIEEKTLKNGLKGYEDYMKRVKSRIIPKLF